MYLDAAFTLSIKRFPAHTFHDGLEEADRGAIDDEDALEQLVFNLAVR